MPLVDSAFADPRLAVLYDVAESERRDLVHYQAIVQELGAQSVLDIGCGTGTFACALAEIGIQVVGVDPAAASLEIARRKPHSETVKWILGDATAMPPLGVDIAVMTGNVAQIFLTDDEWMATLRGAHGALGLGGHLVFEVRDPAHRGWEAWTENQSRTTLVVPEVGSVEMWVELVEFALPLVSFRWTYQFDDGTNLTSESTLRFRSRVEIEASLIAAGYVLVAVRDAPDRPGKEFVFIARRVD